MFFPLWSLTNWSHTVSKVTRGGKIITGCVSDLVYVQCRVYLPRPSPQWAERSSGSPPRPWGLRSVWSCVESTSGLQKRRVAQNAVCFFFYPELDDRSLTHQRRRKRRWLDVCEYAAHVSLLSSPLVSLCWWWPLGVLLWGAEKLKSVW